MTDGAGVLDLPAALVAALGLLVVPGWLVARGWRLRGWVAVGLAVPLSCLVVGVAGLLGPVVGVAWWPGGWGLIGGIAAVLAAAGALAGRAWHPCVGGPVDPRAVAVSDRRRGWGRIWLPSALAPSGAAGAGRGRLVLLLAAAGAGTVLAACLLIGDTLGTGRLDAPAQAFDAVFHLSAVQTIRADGNASSLGGLAGMYGGRTVYYPLVWHAIAALLPGLVPLATNALVAAIAGLWPTAIAGLVATVQPGRGRVGAGSAAVVVVLSAGLVGFPVVLTTLSVWPYALSVLCLPGVLAGAVACGRAWHGGGTRAAAPAAVLTVLAAGGTVLAHGAGVFNLAVLAAPAVAAGLWRGCRAGRRTPARWRGWGAVVSAGVVLALAGGVWVMRGPLGSVLGYQRPGGSAVGTLAQALADLPMYGPVGYGAAVPLGLVIAALAVAGWWSGRHRPLIRLWAATAALALALVVLTGGPQWPLRQLGAPWYLQKARIVPLAVIPTLVLAAGGAQCWWDRHARERHGRPDRLAAACVVGALLVAGRVPALVQQARWVHDPGQVVYGTLATSEELGFYRRLAGELPSGAVVIGAPSRGASYLWSVSGVRVLYPMRAEPDGAAWDLARLAPGESGFCVGLEQAGAELEAGAPAAAEVMGAGGLDWYYLQVERSEEGLVYGSAPLRWDERLAGWDTAGMELVDREETPTGTVTLWHLPQCSSASTAH